MARRFLLLLLLPFVYAVDVHGEAALFLEEPFGTFGRMNPTGHAAIYLSRVCADSPVRLRLCEPDEPGVVISRYHRVGGYDWIAIPLIPYLYAVESPEEVPLFANPPLVMVLRNQYRRKHLQQIAPDADDGEMPDGEWTQLVGASFDRKLFVYEIETSEEQDLQLIGKLNSAGNRSRFNLLFRNCADFSRGVLNTYYPHAVHRSILADQGITTPKQVAKSLASYSRRHPDLRFTCFAITQIPGTMSRSRTVRGVFESFLKSKKYVLPVAMLHPLITGGMAIVYLAESHCDPRRNITHQVDAETQPADIMAHLQSHQASPEPTVDFVGASASE